MRDHISYREAHTSERASEEKEGLAVFYDARVDFMPK